MNEAIKLIIVKPLALLRMFLSIDKENEWR